MTALIAGEVFYNIGEMAHIIARRSDGPRGQPLGGSDDYQNIILLCPTCHTRVDKAPSQHPEEMLHEWKQAHEAWIRNKGSEKLFPSLEILEEEVSLICDENKSLWEAFGPKSILALSSPDSNLHVLWAARELDTIIPNNRNLINMITSNTALLDKADRSAFQEFKIHSAAFELNQYERLDIYPGSPESFRERFCR